MRGPFQTMLDTRWQKVLADLWKQRGRTLIVALAIAVGVFAVGIVVNARTILVREYDSDQGAALPASAIVDTYPFDEDLARSVARLPGVAAAEGRTLVRTRVFDSGGKPRELVLVAVPDFINLQVDSLTPLDGFWPPRAHEIILERMAPKYLGASIGEPLTFVLDDGTEKTLTVVGTAHDAQRPSPDITGTAYGYVTLQTLSDLGVPTAYTALHVRVAGDTGDKAHILAVMDGVEAHLRRTGRPILARRIITESLAAPFIDTVVLILTTFGVVILLLSGFLVVNAMTALITQQIPQIGVMKLIGARQRQIVTLYMVTVLVYGLVAIALAMPLSLLTARLLMTEMVNKLLNVMPESYTVPLGVLAVQAAVGVLLPLLAGLAPVLRGTRITIQRALNDANLGAAGYGQGRVERLLARLEVLRRAQRPLLLAVRNTLRHKGRLVQTLVVLTFGTALFVSVISVRSSVNATLDAYMRFHLYDASVDMKQAERVVRLEQAIGQVPGVAQVELWSTGGAARVRADGSKSDSFRVYAVPAGTTFISPEVLQGEWLTADSRIAEEGSVGDPRSSPGQALRPSGAYPPVVVNSELLDAEPDLRVGSIVELEVDGRKAQWRIEGVVPTESRGSAAYVNLDDYAYATRTPGQATRVLVRMLRHDETSQHAMATLLAGQLEGAGIQVKGTETSMMIRSENSLLFTIVVAFLILMALLLAAVGGLGLTTTMNINLLERVREIGVLRAIGASNASVRTIVLLEGVAMGLFSWLVGVLLSLLISPFLSEQLGLALIKVPLHYHYAWLAAVAWFFVLQAVAVVASLGPARNAVRLTVREVLAYE
jgi:putative ABC transport system permease protein